MKITVTEVNKCVDDELLVSFSSPYGSAHGYWMEKYPEVKKSYHVEFHIPQTLAWGKDIEVAGFDESKIWNENDITYICVVFHSFEEDNCLTVRLGESLILIETEGEPIINSKFLIICFRKMNIYPYSL